MLKNNALRKLKKENRIKLLFVLLALIVFIATDTFCFGVLIDKAGEGIKVTVFAGFLFGCITNIAAYLCADKGIGQLIEIPSERDIGEIENDKIKAVTKKDMKRAKGIFILTLIIILLLQSALGFLRYQQIEENDSEYKTKLKVWEEFQKDAKFEKLEFGDQQRHISKKPIYADDNSSKILDWSTLIFPIFTSVMSFVIGLANRKKYNGLDTLIEKIYAEIEEIHNEFENAIKTKREDISNALNLLEKKKDRKLAELQQESDMLKIKAHNIITEIEEVGNFTGLGDALMKLILNNETKPESDCRRKLGEKLKQTLPEYYKSHIDQLVTSLKKTASDIKKDLSKLAQNANIFDERTLEYKNLDKLNNLASYSTDIFDETEAK